MQGLGSWNRSLKTCSTSFLGARSASLSTLNCLRVCCRSTAAGTQGSISGVCVGWVAKLCLTLCDPWTVGHQASLSMEFSREEHWRGLPFSPLGDLLDLGTEPASPALAGRFFTIVPPGKPNLCRGRWQMPFASTNLLLTLWKRELKRFYAPDSRKEVHAFVTMPQCKECSVQTRRHC